MGRKNFGGYSAPMVSRKSGRRRQKNRKADLRFRNKTSSHTVKTKKERKRKTRNQRLLENKTKRVRTRLRGHVDDDTFNEVYGRFMAGEMSRKGFWDSFWCTVLLFALPFALSVLLYILHFLSTGTATTVGFGVSTLYSLISSLPQFFKLVCFWTSGFGDSALYPLLSNLPQFCTYIFWKAMLLGQIALCVGVLCVHVLVIQRILSLCCGTTSLTHLIGRGKRWILASMSSFQKPTFDVETQISCSICLEDYEPEELQDSGAIVQLSCGHRFHSDCINPWLARKGTCPLCRQRHY